VLGMKRDGGRMGIAHVKALGLLLPAFIRGFFELGDVDVDVVVGRWTRWCWGFFFLDGLCSLLGHG
jgi:hypothetical protein